MWFASCAYPKSFNPKLSNSSQGWVGNTYEISFDELSGFLNIVYEMTEDMEELISRNQFVM